MAGIGVKTLARFCDRVGTSLEAGVDVRRVLSVEAGRAQGRLKTELSAVNDDIAAGYELADAFDRRGAYFPVLVRRMLKVGEASGRVDAIFKQLASHYEEIHTLRSNFLAAIAWPAIQFLLAVLTLTLLIWIQGWLGTDILGLGLMGGAGAVKFLLFVGLLVGGVIFVSMGVLQGWFGPGVMYLAMQVPKVGRVLSDSALSRFSWTLAVALDAGMDARGSMQLALQSTNNQYFMADARAIDAEIEQGREFHVSLERSAAFPREFLEGLETAELAGTHSESMHTLAKEYQIRARAGLRTLVGIAIGVVWITIAGTIIYFIFRLAMFYLNTINSALEGF